MLTKLYPFSDSRRKITTVCNSADKQFGRMNTSLSDSELSESLDGNESERSSVYSNTTSSSTSTYTSTHFDYDEEKNRSTENDIELIQIRNTIIRLPRDLCANKDIFEELFSLDTWNILPKEIQQSLITFLPKFEKVLESPEDVRKEQQNTIEMFFNNQLDCFGFTPLQRIQQELEAGNYRPDVVKLRKSIEKSTRREQRFQTCERLSYLARELFIKRERLLRNVYKSAAPEGAEPLIIPHHAPNNICVDEKMYVVRARQRYAQEIKQLLNHIGLKSSDLKDHDNENHIENEDDKDIYFAQSFSRPKINLGNNGVTEKYIYGTLFKRQHDLTDEDAQYQQYAKQPRLSNKSFRTYLQAYKRRKLTEPNLPEFENTDLRLRDVCTRAQMGGNFKRLFSNGKVPAHQTKKHKLNEKYSKENEPRSLHLYNGSRDNSEMSRVGMSYDMLDGDIDLQQEEVISTNFIQPSVDVNCGSFQDTGTDHINVSGYTCQNKMTIKQENNIMLIPKLHPLQNLKSQNVTSFFSLIRDFFCETSHHRLQLSELKDKLDSWLLQPNNQLTSKNWHSAIENWTEQVASALDFLCGEFLPLPEEYVPYLEFKTNVNIYQWIGAGRDSDVRLLTLCEHWLQWQKPITTITKFVEPTLCNNSSVKAKDPKQSLVKSGNNFVANSVCANTIHITITTMAAPTTGIATATTTSTINSTNNEPVTVIGFDNPTLADNTPPPPPSRCPTNWIVRSAANEEIKEFQRQERERFEHPHRAFTYRLHGYESIVGPVKGVYSEIHAMTKARGHTMMVGDRPNFVTILTLVRDAVARLPNGEGTRADIAELVKSSQYLNHNAAENVLQTIVSGALDRMHTENDPCVRYDPKRKIWIYLHRHRSEEEFERIHHEQQTMLKSKKPNRKHNKRPQMRTVPAATTVNSTITTTKTTANNNIHNMLSNPPPLASVSATCPLPSLVAANTTMSYPQQQQQLKQNQILLKCPPVPPLKYHVPPSAIQQQKSLLKSRSDDTPQSSQQRILVRPISTTHTIDKTDDKKLVSKQQHPKVSQQVTVPRNIATKLTSKTPILLATPNGLQAVHMPNVTNVCGPNTSSIIVTPTTLSTAGMNNKKLTLNKPLLINQITTTKSTQQQHQNHKQNKNISLMKQQSVTPQPTQSFIIPFNDALVQSVSGKSPQSQGTVQAMFVDNNGKIQPLQQESHRPGQGKNVLRLISSAQATHIKSQPPQNKSTQVQVLGAQKSPTAIITTTANIAATTSTTSSAMSGLSIITANRNVSGGTIVKMTPQAFAVLQQQQQQQISKQQQQHIILKPTKMLGSVSNSVTQVQQRLNVGNTGIITSQQSHNNILKTFSPISVHNSSTLTTTVSSIPITTNNNNNNMIKKGIQTIPATNLSLQQQRTLLHGLKQQKQKQQNTQMSKTSTITNLMHTPAYTCKQNATRTINETSTTTVATTPTTVPTRVITSTAGQIISLEDLLQKQRGKQNSTTIPQIVTLTSCGTQQQASGSQFGIVVSPTTRGIISINQTSNTGISTAQSASTPTVPINSMSKALLLTTTTTSTVTSPSISTSKSVSSSTGPTSTVPTTKTIISSGRVLMTAPNAGTLGGNIRIINASNTNNLNFTNLQGKQVVFSTKNSSQLQNSNVVVGGHAVKLQGNVTSGNQLQTVIVGNQILRVQQITSQAQNMKGIGGTIKKLTFPLTKTTTTQATMSSQLSLNVPIDTASSESTSSSSQRFILEGNGKTMQLQTTGQKANAVEDLIRLEDSNKPQTSPTSTVTNASTVASNMLQGGNRVVLAVQSGGPFILPAGTFQGGTLNLKSLQNMKLVSLAASAASAPTSKETQTPQQKAPL